MQSQRKFNNRVRFNRNVKQSYNNNRRRFKRNFSRKGQFQKRDNLIGQANRKFRFRRFYIPKRGYSNLPQPTYNVRKKTKALGSLKIDKKAYYEYKEPIDSVLPQASDFDEIRKFFIDKVSKKEDIRLGTNSLKFVSEPLPLEYIHNENIIANSYDILTTFYLDQLLISPVYRKSFSCFYKEIWEKLGVYQLNEESTSKVLAAIEKDEQFDITTIVDTETQKERSQKIVEIILAKNLPDDKLKDLSKFLLIKNAVDIKDTIYDAQIDKLSATDVIIPTYYKTVSNYWRTRIGSLSNYDPREVKLSLLELTNRKLILDVNSQNSNNDYTIQPNDLHLFIISILGIQETYDPIALITQQYRGQPIYMLVF